MARTKRLSRAAHRPGRRISVDAIIISKIKDGKIVQHWIQWNPAALIQQLNGASAQAEA